MCRRVSADSVDFPQVVTHRPATGPGSDSQPGAASALNRTAHSPKARRTAKTQQAKPACAVAALACSSFFSCGSIRPVSSRYSCRKHQGSRLCGQERRTCAPDKDQQRAQYAVHPATRTLDPRSRRGQAPIGGNAGIHSSDEAQAAISKPRSSQADLARSGESHQGRRGHSSATPMSLL